MVIKRKRGHMNAALLEVEQLTGGGIIRVARAKARVVVEHDRRRAMNHMDDETKAIHIRLDEWSTWVRRAFVSLGYPTESYYHKWAALKIAPNPGFEPEMPERPANVDKAVARLGELDKSVIWRYYCQFRPERIWMHLHGVDGQSTFDRILKRARWRISGFLLAIESA